MFCQWRSSPDWWQYYRR